MHPVSLSLLVILGVFLACAGAQYSNPIQVGPSTNPAPVTNASIQKVSDLASEMYSRWEVLDQACDPRAVFAVAYLFMTANARRLITDLYFDDGNNMADFILSMSKNLYPSFRFVLLSLYLLSRNLLFISFTDETSSYAMY
jgi:hypothetical protein